MTNAFDKNPYSQMLAIHFSENCTHSSTSPRADPYPRNSGRTAPTTAHRWDQHTWTGNCVWMTPEPIPKRSNSVASTQCQVHTRLTHGRVPVRPLSVRPSPAPACAPADRWPARWRPGTRPGSCASSSRAAIECRCGPTDQNRIEHTHRSVTTRLFDMCCLRQLHANCNDYLFASDFTEKLCVGRAAKEQHSG